MFNVANPDDIVATYGADTLRLYEMFLGPLEQSKPWDTNGIDGVNRFLKKLWALFYKGEEFLPDDSAASEEDLRSLHRLIAKVTADIDNFSFNTSVAAFMICVNELTSHRCRNDDISYCNGACSPRKAASEGPFRYYHGRVDAAAQVRSSA